MNIYTYIKKDHKLIDSLFEEILATTDKKERLKLFETLQQELIMHNRSEQDTFYKALEKGNDEKNIEENLEEGEEEHEEIEDYIEKLKALDIESEEWIVTFGEFKHAVTHHVHEEEDTIFPKAKEILSANQEKSLVEDMKEAKKK